MAPVHTKILEILKEAGGELSMHDLVQKVVSPSASAVDVKAAVLPLISADRIELTPDRKLRLRPA